MVLSLVFGAALGLAARRHRVVGSLGIAAFGVAGFLAALADPQHNAGSPAFAAIAGVTAGVATLWLLLRAAAPIPASSGGTVAPAGPDRRTFVRLAAGALGVAGASALIGRALLKSSTRALAAARQKLRLPLARNPVAPPSAAMVVGTRGVTPLVTTNDNFYE